jgi:tetratricopeptide (TPR) repeat protein
MDQAGQAPDPAMRERYLKIALEEFKLAAAGWLGYLRQDENAPDAYTSRCLYADALHNRVRIEVVLNGIDPLKYSEPTSVEIETAERAATAARDSDEDDQYIDSVGLMVVDLADVDRDLAYQRWETSGGRQGVEPRKAPRLVGSEGDQSVEEAPLPEVLEKSMRARDEYIERVPPDRDKQNSATEYAFYTAEQYFIYGHFRDAEARFVPLYEQHCGKDDKGYEAWKRLIQMSNLNKDVERSRVLAMAEKTHSCAFSDKEKSEEHEGLLTDLVLQNAAYSDANKVFDQAKNAPPGPKKDALWRKAGKMYEDALRAAPSHSDAPAAAINSAFCYKQVSEFNKAIDLYQLFIAKYGGDDIMDRLEHGGTDPEKKVKVGPNLTEYKERLKYLGMAYEALSTTYYGFFAYPRAAESFGRIASNRRFDDERRSSAAYNAMTLYSNLGDRNSMSKMYDVLADPKLHLPADERAEVDYVRASFDFGLWNPNGGDTSANVAARRQAIASLSQFHTSNRNVTEAARYSLEAAYRIATMLRAANDTGYHVWLRMVISDWEYFKAHPSVSSRSAKKGSVVATDAPYSDYGAEAEFVLLDEQVRGSFDYATGHHRYAGNVVDIAKDVDRDLGEAEKNWRPQLERVASQYGSFEWAAAATARVGSLYDSIRSGLDLATPKYFTPQQEAMLNKLSSAADKLDAAGMSDKADEVRQRIDDTKDAVRTKWRATEDRYMEACNQKAVSRYATAALTARKFNVKNTTVQAGVARLAFFTDYLGDGKMKRYVENTPDPLSPSGMLSYSGGEFLQWRSGVVSTPPPDGQPAPLPVMP